VTPFAVNFKRHAIPKCDKARRYFLKHRKFMREHIYMLVRMGCLKWNPHSQWSSAVMIVAEPASRGEYRVIVHCKYVDSEVIPTAGCLPNLALILQHLAGLIGLDAWKHLKDSGNFHVQKPLKKCTLR